MELSHAVQALTISPLEDSDSAIDWVSLKLLHSALQTTLEPVCSYASDHYLGVKVGFYLYSWMHRVA